MEEAEIRRSEREREREKNIQQNHANAPPTWVQHTLEIEDDQDKGSQASGQHHPADSVHPHHFQQRWLHGFVLAAGTGVSGRRARGAGAGTPPRGPEPGRRGAELSKAQREDRTRFADALGAPSPGRGVEGAGVGLEVLRCVDPLAARSCSSSSPLRRLLRSRRRPPLPGRGPGGWGASGDGGAAAAAAALAAVAVRRALSLLSKGYFIALQRSIYSGAGFYQMQLAAPGEGRAPAESREEGGTLAPGRSVALPPPLPGIWSRPAVARGVRCARRAPAGSQKPSVPGRARPPSGGCVSVSMTKPGEKKRRRKSPRCCHPPPPAFGEGSGKQRAGSRREELRVRGFLAAGNYLKSLGDVAGKLPQTPRERVPIFRRSELGGFVFLSKDSPAGESGLKRADLKSRLRKLHDPRVRRQLSFPGDLYRQNL